MKTIIEELEELLRIEVELHHHIRRARDEIARRLARLTPEGRRQWVRRLNGNAARARALGRASLAGDDRARKPDERPP